MLEARGSIARVISNMIRKLVKVMANSASPMYAVMNRDWLQKLAR
jgi:hypothetical protein